MMPTSTWLCLWLWLCYALLVLVVMTAMTVIMQNGLIGFVDRVLVRLWSDPCEVSLLTDCSEF